MAQSPIPGWSLLLAGEPGSAKTSSLLFFKDLHRKINSIPFEVGVLALDRNTKPVLGKWADNPKEGEGICKLKTISFVPKGDDPFALFTQLVTDINRTPSQSALIKLGGGSQSQYPQMIEIASACSRFLADDGTDWGNISKWGSNRVLVIDGLTNLTLAARQCSTGHRPGLDKPDYFTVQNIVAGFIRHVLQSCTCHIVLLAHLDREEDEVGGGTRLFPSTFGKKLGPVIGADFSDVVLALFRGGKWSWRTSDIAAATKPGNLPIEGELPPSFEGMFTTPEKGWLAKGGLISTEVAKR